jgi:protein-S-isoprenylcysteine O-methyltransferase Ste14
MTPPAREAHRSWLSRAARWRVPLGFVSSFAVLWLAQPTRVSLVAGGLVALVGQGVRVWAAGHLEKGREVTKSGPYRLVRHPLYAGSSLMGVGLAIASRHLLVAILIALYLSVTLSIAVRSEERVLRDRFGGEYDAYSAGDVTDHARRFSLERAWRNREWRAILGLLVLMAVLAAKAAWSGRL